jgi:hypothetical protein
MEKSIIKLKKRIDHLIKMVHYQELYIQYLIGGITKREFKKRAKEFAEPLDIKYALDKAEKRRDYGE